MAKLNLNFHEMIGCYKPSEGDMGQLETLALSIKSIIQVTAMYANDGQYFKGDKGACEVANNCASVFNALELLIEPLVTYMTDYIEKEAAPDENLPTGAAIGRASMTKPKTK